MANYYDLRSIIEALQNAENKKILTKVKVTSLDFFGGNEWSPANVDMIVCLYRDGYRGQPFKKLKTVTNVSYLDELESITKESVTEYLSNILYG